VLCNGPDTPYSEKASTKDSRVYIGAADNRAGVIKKALLEPSKSTSGLTTQPRSQDVYRRILSPRSSFWHIHERCTYKILPCTLITLWSKTFDLNTKRIVTRYYDFGTDEREGCIDDYCHHCAIGGCSSFRDQKESSDNSSYLCPTRLHGIPSHYN
jgi:hypothetical protein